MEPKLPTYRDGAALVESENGSGWRMVGWTVARSALIAVPMLAIGVRTDKAITGSLLASTAMTALALWRINGAIERR
jgi:hypothetical protein